MNKRWMRIINQGNDPDIGAALVRLAERAAELHRDELADQPFEVGQGDDTQAAAHALTTNEPHRITPETDR